MDEFAGKTPTGNKIHRCFTKHSAACSYTMRRRIPYFYPVKGKVKKDSLCCKCWGDNPSPEYLIKFGLEIQS